ncbi:cytochrome c, partial [Bradyrhizobium sp.]|uniref:cytochrome c n=1 Tax=Bradyrhizobium sp. TaxID=376 RepID=UPI0040377836
MKIAVCLAGALAAIAATGFPSLATAGDARTGRQLAERWCQSCHAIAANQPLAVTEAPPFATIARKPGFDQAKTAAFLLEPHPKMPPIGLSREA